MQWVVQEIILLLFILPLQFDYEGFVYDCFENGDTFPVLESLVIRNLKLSTDEPLFDNCKYTYLLTYLRIYRHRYLHYSTVPTAIVLIIPVYSS